MTVTVFVPRDSSAISRGADKVAQAIAVEAARRGATIELVRNGSRGMFWLEPMVEVSTPEGRVAYGPVKPDDVAELFEADFLYGGQHHLRLGLTEDIPYYAKQQLLTFERG